MMLEKIKDFNDVELFAKLIVEEGINFHPDEDFNNYINLESNQATFTEQEAMHRNELMDQCFAVCETAKADIYEVMNKVFVKETGIDKLMFIGQ